MRICAYTHAYMLAYTQAYMFAYTRAYMLAYTHAYAGPNSLEDNRWMTQIPIKTDG